MFIKLITKKKRIDKPKHQHFKRSTVTVYQCISRVKLNRKTCSLDHYILCLKVKYPVSDIYVSVM